MGKTGKVDWSKASKADLDHIYSHYLEYAPEAADKRIESIFEAVDELIFKEQWQGDEFDEKSRRIIVDKRFRVVYRLTDSGIVITRVHPAKKDPRGFRKGNT